MTKIVEGKLPYSGGTAIDISANKVISLLLRSTNNLLQVNGDNELYCDLQLATGIRPNDTFPVGVTVGKVLSSDGWPQNGLVINYKTTSGDYGRWIYGANKEIYFDGGEGTWKQVYFANEVDSLFTDLTNSLATVAFTGDYNDLKNRPEVVAPSDGELTISKNGEPIGTFTANQATDETIDIEVPTTVAELTDSSDYVTDTELSNALADYTPTANLAAVALSNDYDDLDDKPTIGDATLTIQKNGTTVNSIKMNATTDVTANIVVPTDTSDLTNNAGFVTNQVNDTAYGSSWNGVTTVAPSKNAVYDKISAMDTTIAGKADSSSLATVATSGSYADLTNKPTIPTVPTNVSAFNNDSGYLTSATGVTTVNGSHGAVTVQPTLVSGTNIKTINSTSLLGSGNIAVQPTISDLATIRSGASAGATAVQPGDLATVATSGSYNDLSNKPTIPAAQVNSDWNATSGVAQILNKPTVPTSLSGLTNDLYSTISVTLASNGWNSDVQSVTATGVKSSSTVIVSPSPSSINDYYNNSVYCLTQGSNSLTFVCGATPENDITVNILIMN